MSFYTGLFFARFLDSHLQKCSQKLSFGFFYWVLRGKNWVLERKNWVFWQNSIQFWKKYWVFRFFYISTIRSKLLQLCLKGQKPLYFSVVNVLKSFLTFGVAKNREKLSFSMKIRSVLAKNWVLVKYWVFWRIQFWP